MRSTVSGRKFPGEPCVSARRIQMREDVVGGRAENSGEQMRDHVRIGDFRWHREAGVHRHAHRQRLVVAVENIRAARTDFHDQPLLVLGAIQKIAVAEQLQVGQPDQRRSHPERRNTGHQKNPAAGTSQIH